MTGLVRQRESERHEVIGTVWEGAQLARRRVMSGVWQVVVDFPAKVPIEVYSGEMVRVRTVTRAAAAAAALVLLAGCGGGDDNPEDAAATTLGEVLSTEGAAVLMDAQSLTALDQSIAYPKKKQAQISSEIEVLEPGQESGWRKYRVPVYVYVMEGTISVEYDAGVVKDFPKGSSFLQAKGIWHNISNKAEVRAETLSVLMGAKGINNMAER